MYILVSYEKCMLFTRTTHCIFELKILYYRGNEIPRDNSKQNNGFFRNNSIIIIILFRMFTQ
jgi:hypothetical protein